MIHSRVLGLVGLGAIVLSLGCQQTTQTSNTARDPDATLTAILLVSDKSCEVSSQCASTLCVAERCIALVDTTQSWMEKEIAAALQQLIDESPNTLAILLKSHVPQLREQDVYVQARLAGVLGHLKEEQTIPTLQSMAESDSEIVRVGAKLALNRMGHSPSFPTLNNLLTHRSEAVVLCATDALGAYLADKTHGPTAKSLLVGQLKHENHRVRHRAVLTLGQSKQADPTIISALIETLQSEGDGFLRYDAFQALIRLDPKQLAAALLTRVESQ